MSTTTDLISGDLVLFSTSPGGEGKLAKIIKAASRRKGEEETFAAHTEIVGHGGALLPNNDGSITTIGTSWPTIKERDLIEQKGAMVRVYRLLGANNYQMQKMVDELRSKAKAINPETYGTGVIIAHALDYGFNWSIHKVSSRWLDLRPFSTVFFRSKSVCSSLIAKAYSKYHAISFGMRPRVIQPDDIDDFCRDHPANFKLVYEGII